MLSMEILSSKAVVIMKYKNRIWILFWTEAEEIDPESAL